MTKAGHENRRSFLGHFIRPRQQMRYALLFSTSSLALVTIFTLLHVLQLSSAITALVGDRLIQPEGAEALLLGLRDSAFLIVGFAGTCGVAVFGFGVRLSHRIYGPIVPITAYIENLKNERFDKKLTLRQGDELQEIVDALNDLAETLKTRRGPAHE